MNPFRFTSIWITLCLRGAFRVDGQFDPWNVAKIADTPVSGSYTFSDAHLDSLPGIGGTLSSQGSFAGPANALRVQGRNGNARLPREIRRASGELKDGLPGRRQLLQWRRDLADRPGAVPRHRRHHPRRYQTPQRRAAGWLRCKSMAAEGRIEDFLWLLTAQKAPAMIGPMAVHVHVVIPGGKRPFIQRIRLQGEFKIDGATFTKPDTQAKVEHFELPRRRPEGPQVRRGYPGLLPPLSRARSTSLDGCSSLFASCHFSFPARLPICRGLTASMIERVDFQGESAGRQQVLHRRHKASPLT